MRQRRLSEIQRHVLRISCRRCERTVEIQTVDAVRLYGGNAVWKDVAQRLLDNTCQQRTDCRESRKVVQNRQMTARSKPRRLDSTEVCMSLASKIKELRVKKTKSLQDVADDVGASKNHIWDLETGKSKNPSIELLTKLAKCFRVSVAELIGENPAAKDVDPQVVAMYRELKELSSSDRQAIQTLMDHLRNKK